MQGSIASMMKPYLTADGKRGEVLTVPTRALKPADQKEYIYMDGMEVYQRAVRKMILALKKACKENQVDIDDLDLIVPHQANQNIIDSVRFAIKLPEEKIFSHIENFGNTSSTTIPAALSESLPKLKSGQKVGLVAFGGGFTFGATILEIQ